MEENVIDNKQGVFTYEESALILILAHRTAIERLTAAGAVPNTALALVTELFRDWKSPVADAARSVIKPYLADIQSWAPRREIRELERPTAPAISPASEVDITDTIVTASAASSLALPGRRVIRRTPGSGHGPIVRLMSPSDIGQIVKPFVFLDLFEADMGQMRDAMAVHPHSGIATVTVFTEGDVRFEDPDSGAGTIAYGGVEWLRAGGGVWHGKEISPGASPRVQGFQLWVALPPELENAASESQYLEAEQMKHVGPAQVIVGAYEGVQSPVRAPVGINYLLVTLKRGESWTYQPPKGHSVGWLAVAKGALSASEVLPAGDMAVLEQGEAPIKLAATGDTEVVFVLGSAVPHNHRLHLGYYSVHTSAEALERGEAHIAELGRKLAAAGDRRTKSGLTPVSR